MMNMSGTAVEISPQAGDWVIMKGDRVIANNPNASVILREAESYPRGSIVISRVPKSDYCFY